MELVPGQTLQTPLPQAEALRIAVQIAEALEAAHEKGIIHRDLKPANIMITPTGVVKVLDFGLAAVPQRSADGDASNSPTLTMRTTQAGMIMGTAGYMSPEQAAGKPVDRRADIWSFGVVLWEMLTGRRLFDGETVSHTLAHVLTAPIDFNQLPDKTPEVICHLLRRCLDRDIKTRLRDIGEARIVVQKYLADPPSETIAAATASRHTVPWIPWAVACALGLALIAASAIAYRGTRPALLRPLISLSLDVPDETSFSLADSGGVALTGDGSRLVLTLRAADGNVRLYTRLAGQNQMKPLAGTEGARDPFFSPDGEWIRFFADSKLKKISVEGGAAITLCDAPNNRGASWGDDGNIIVSLTGSGVLSRVPSAGGAPVPVTKLARTEGSLRWPQVLPGSRAVLYTATVPPNYDDSIIAAVSLQTGEQKTLLRGGFSPQYIATSHGSGHLIYLRQSTLFAVAFDPARLTPTGTPVPILEEVASSATEGGIVAFGGEPSGPGAFLYLRGNLQQGGGLSIFWIGSAGKTQPLHAPPAIYRTPRLSPDGKRLAFDMLTAQGDDIWVKDLDRDTPSRLTFLTGSNRWPTWAPDGGGIVFESTNPSAPGLYWMRSDGSGEAQRLSDGRLGERPSSFSPDGKRLAFSQIGNGGSDDIFTARIEGDPGHPRLGKPELFVGTPAVESSPMFSPDGRWLAYQSNESGIFEVYVRPFPPTGGRWQISTAGGMFPVWSRDGHELLFKTMDRRMMAVSYAAKGDSFAAGRPRVWSEIRGPDMGNLSTYDLAPDGKRLAAIVGNDEINGQKPSMHLTFLVNFFDELRRKVPVGE